MVLVDTCVWSLALQRRSDPQDPAADALAELIRDGRAAMIGPVRQEILSGLREPAQFERLRDVLRAFPDQTLSSEDYERAAEMFNACRRQGIQGANTDFLICAHAERCNMAILTVDQDFEQFARVLPIRLVPLLLGNANNR